MLGECVRELRMSQDLYEGYKDLLSGALKNEWMHWKMIHKIH